jgi:hypothetical protein
MEVTDIHDGVVRLSRVGMRPTLISLQRWKRFTRELAYTPANDVLVVFRSRANYGAGVKEGVVVAWRGQTIGRCGTKGKRCRPRWH